MIPAFSSGYLRERVAENLNMIETDIGANSQKRRQDVGRIQPTSQADFDNANIDFLLGEVLECERGDYLKEGDFFFTSVLRYRSTNAATASLRNLLPAHLDSFSEIDQVRRCIQAGPVPLAREVPLRSSPMSTLCRWFRRHE